MKRTPLVILGGAAALAVVPLLGLPAFYESFLYLVLHWIVLATSWNILSGYTGYFSFGHGAFFGAGLYTSTTLLAKYDWPFLWTLPVAAAVAAVLGVVLGAIVFRVKGVRGELFALLTLAITFVIGTIVVNTPLDGGSGVSLTGVAVPKLGPRASSTFFLLALVAATATLLIAWWIAVSRFGAGLFAIHDDEDAAEVLGVPTYRYKLYALAISCALAGVAGGIHALFLSYVTVGEVFTITVPLTVVLMSVLGGTRHWAGPAIGAVAITALLYAFTAADHAIAGKAASGAILIAAILFMPEGILPRLLRLFRRRPAREPSARPVAAAPPTADAFAVPAPAPAPAPAAIAEVGPDGPTSLAVPSFTLSDDDAVIARGKATFDAKGCGACHKFGSKLVGPDLTGLTERRSLPWIARMIRYPEQMTKTDPVARDLYRTLMVQMTDQGVAVADLPALVSYIHEAGDDEAGDDEGEE